MRYLTFIFVLVALLGADRRRRSRERKVTNEIVDNTTDFTGAYECMMFMDNDLTMSAAQAQWATSETPGIGEDGDH